MPINLLILPNTPEFSHNFAIIIFVLLAFLMERNLILGAQLRVHTIGIRARTGAEAGGAGAGKLV